MKATKTTTLPKEPYVRITVTESALKRKPVMRLVKALIRELGR